MILSSTGKAGLRGRVINVDTGQEIRWVRRFEVETGFYEAFRRDPERAVAGAHPVLRRRILQSLLYIGRARIRFEPADTSRYSQASLINVACKPPNTPEQERAEILAIAPDYVKNYRPIVREPGVPTQECDMPKCHRPADWETADEQEIDPSRLANGSPAERAVTVKQHRYCNDCFQNPTFTTLRGVTHEVEVTVRPQ